MSVLSQKLKKLTLSKRVLFDVLSADGNVLQEALSGVGTPLLHWVLGTEGEHGQVLQWQQQFDEGQVQLLGKDLPHLVAFVLQEAPGGFVKKALKRKKHVTSHTSCISIMLMHFTPFNRNYGKSQQYLVYISDPWLLICKIL